MLPTAPATRAVGPEGHDSARFRRTRPSFRPSRRAEAWLGADELSHIVAMLPEREGEVKWCRRTAGGDRHSDPEIRLFHAFVTQELFGLALHHERPRLQH